MPAVLARRRQWEGEERILRNNIEMNNLVLIILAQPVSTQHLVPVDWHQPIFIEWRVERPVSKITIISQTNNLIESLMKVGQTSLTNWPNGSSVLQSIKLANLRKLKIKMPKTVFIFFILSDDFLFRKSIIQ